MGAVGRTEPMVKAVGAGGCWRVGTGCSNTLGTQEDPAVHPRWVQQGDLGAGWVQLGVPCPQMGENAVLRVWY